MRTVIHLVWVIILCASCGKPKDSLPPEVILPDTMYNGDFLWRQKAVNKRLTVLFDNGNDREKPIFKLYEANLLRIRVKGLTEYEIYPSEVVGVEILKADTSFNLFIVTPRDTSFIFVVNQYYPKGRVIGCTRNWNNETNDYDEQLAPVNGFRKITRFEWSVH
jgi:hypothetical protein